MMAKDRVVVERLSEVSLDRQAEGYVLIWYLAEEGDYGGILDGLCTEAALAKAKGEEWEAIAMDIESAAVANATGATRSNGYFLWPSRRAAANALKAVKARVAARRSNRPLPEWAATALTEGWSPPKGWAP